MLIYEPKGRAREYAALALNVYRGCEHICRYCYAPDALFTTRTNFATAYPRPNFTEQLEREIASRPIPEDKVLLCFSCDPYTPLDDKLQHTRRALLLLREYFWSFDVLTKGGYRSARDMDLFGRGDSYGTTLTCLNPEDTAYYEPGAASTRERLDTLIAFHNKGISTWVSMEPVLDPEQALDLINFSAPYVDLFKVGKLNWQKTMPDDLKQLAKSIDWRKFAADAVTLLEKLGKQYYIKNDLRAYLPAQPTNEAREDI